ncbi:hypothetical protein ACFYO2_32270 [Streptomyces sp. NPDC006602]|uniref:hypothetical protein n=1 Tax=Streptomyces sp. NPDC006602 TaxID=3364751 RepID=UPI0036BF3527
MLSVNRVLCGLAANAALPSELVDRLIAVADADIAADLACRADLGHAQAVALASRVEESAVQLVYEGRLSAADVDPVAQPDAALAFLQERAGTREWARLVAADPNPDATPALLEDLTRREPSVHRAFREVARHRNATAPALLACLADKQARPIAAGHPALPAPVIVELLTDADRQVVAAAAANPSLPVAVMSDLRPRP